MIVKRKSLLDNIRPEFEPGLLSVDNTVGVDVADPDPADIVEEATRDVNQGVFDAISSELTALEELDQVKEQLTLAVAQNEVNLAALQGEDTPTVGSDFEVLNTEGKLVDTVPAPAPELEANTTPEDIVSKTLDTEAAIECFSGILTKFRANDTQGVYNALGIRRTSLGLESINSNPLGAYKEACEGMKEILSKIGIIMRRAALKVLDMLSRIKEGIANAFTDNKYILKKIINLDPRGYRVRQDAGLVISESLLFILPNNGVGCVSNPMKAYKEIVDGYVKFCTTLKPQPLIENSYAKSLKSSLLKNSVIDRAEMNNDDILLPCYSKSVLAINASSYRVRKINIRGISIGNLLPDTVEGRLALCKNAANEALSNYNAIISLAHYVHDSIEDFLVKYTEVKEYNKYGQDVTGVPNKGKISVSYNKNDGLSVEAGNQEDRYYRKETKHKLPVGNNHSSFEYYNNIFDGYTKISKAICDNYSYVPRLLKEILATMERDI